MFTLDNFSDSHYFGLHHLQSHNWLQQQGGTQVSSAPEGKGKLDGVGPVDNRPSTAKLHHFVREKKEEKNVDMWQVTGDMRQVTRYTWQATRDTWHML